MGAVSHNIPNQNWTFVRRDDKYQIYRNDKGELAEKHIILNNPKLSQQQEKQTYYYRFTTKKPIVKAYWVEYQNNRDICSNYKNIEVFTQYIPYRLIDIKSLTHEQGLYVLSESLVGFYELFQKLGAFPVDHSLIGFNQNGSVKVWHSPNFAKNHFDSDNIILMSTENPHNFDQRLLQQQEEEMVDDIWSSVDSHACFSGDFRTNIGQIQDFNFRTLKEVTDNYIKSAQFVPSHLKFQDKNGIIQKSRYLAQSSRYSSGGINRANAANELQRR